MIFPFHDVDVGAYIQTSTKPEATPEPEDPPSNLTWLADPVHNILHPTRPHDAVEGYSVLAARIKAAIFDKDGSEVAVDSTWPLFAPLRNNRASFVKAMERDLGRALEDPSEGQEDENRKLSYSLPSPVSSPAAKTPKQGMTAEQATRARDLCQATHAALKFLAAFLAFPAVYSVLDGARALTL